MEKEKQIEEMARDLSETYKGNDCLFTNACDICEYTKYQGNKEYPCGAMKHAKEMIVRGYRKERRGEWISVEDRLPKNNLARVLVFLKDAEFTRPIGFNKIDTDRCIDGKWARWGEYVTHWQPLPQPPKMKGAE